MELQRESDTTWDWTTSQSENILYWIFQLYDKENGKLGRWLTKKKERKKSVVAWECCQRMNRQSTEYFQWKYCIWYHNDRHTPLNICSNPYKVQHKEWNVNCGLCMITMCQCKLILGESVPFCDVDNGEGYAVYKICGKALFFLFNIFANLKLF